MFTFTTTTIAIIIAMFLIAFLVFLNVTFDNEKEYPSMHKLVQRIDIVTVVALLVAIIKFNLWC